ncbi:hypothetical protein DL768_003099 [Monosporascus sp. mg162]|nr:hypothetical protein DL768_003099 [Monosporascus sp. mg162]
MQIQLLITAAKHGSNGCISSCGSDIVNNDVGPEEVRVIGHFQAWNMDRKCLHMDISKITKVAPIGWQHYTHVHFAFPNITSDLAVKIGTLEDQFSDFTNLTGIKKTVSFGSWAFPNDAPTYEIFRTAVSTEINRQKLARNIIRFVKTYDIDGPSQPDRDEAVAVDDHEGGRAVEQGCRLYGVIRAELQDEPGRLHVSHVHLHGRLAKLERGEGSLYRHDGLHLQHRNDEAKISDNNPDLYGERPIGTFHDQGDILVYDDTEWVSYLEPKTYLNRSATWYALNFGGTSDWSVLVNNFKDGGKGNELDPYDSVDSPICDFSFEFDDLDELQTPASG